MTRTQRDIVNYFPHDSNASSGDTLTILQSRFGNDGYAFWFKLLEKLASSDGHYIDCSDNIRWQLLLAKTGVDAKLGVEILLLLVEMQAIDKELWDSKVIWCQKLVDNLTDVYKNRRREIPRKPLFTKEKAITTSRNKITTSSYPQSKVEYSKVDNNINIYGEFLNVKLSDEDFKKLVDKFGEKRANYLIENLSGYMKQNPKNEKKYKDHYATIINWARMEEQRGGNSNGIRTNQSGRLPTHYTEPEDIRTGYQSGD